jgi:hypothetical protein
MNRFAFIVLTMVALAGCASKPESGKKTATPPKRERVMATNLAEVVEPPPKTRVLPMAGRVAKVNHDLNFVIIDFTNTRQPKLEQRLSIYRVGQKVGEVVVSGPFRNTTVAADIVAGEAKYGDEVRTQ